MSENIQFCFITHRSVNQLQKQYTQKEKENRQIDTLDKSNVDIENYSIKCRTLYMIVNTIVAYQDKESSEKFSKQMEFQI